MSRFVLIASAIAHPAFAQGAEGNLAPVIDLKPRREAAPVLTSKELSSVSHARGYVSDKKQQPKAGKASPTVDSRTQQGSARAQAETSTAKLAPVIKVYEPIIAARVDKGKSSKDARKPTDFGQLTQSDAGYPTRDTQNDSEGSTPRVEGGTYFGQQKAPVVSRSPGDDASQNAATAATTSRRQRPVPTDNTHPMIIPAGKPLLVSRRQATSASDLPVPTDRPAPEEIEAVVLDLKPINAVSASIKSETGEMPKDHATDRFVSEGEVAHRLGFSRTSTESQIMWQAPAICHRPLYFEEVNLERHGYKVPLVQPAVSGAHFFGRVLLLPYTMLNEGHRNCKFTLGHYRPGNDAPFALHVSRPQFKRSHEHSPSEHAPRLLLDVIADEAEVLANVIFPFQ